jgi:uncharacterized membrane protein YeaQ/YmgE (transglycosylase-associated protein family)
MADAECQAKDEVEFRRVDCDVEDFSMSWLAWIVVGIIGGFLGKLVIKGEGPGGLLGDLIIGIVGAILGGWVFSVFGANGVTGINVWSIIVAFVGSVVLLWIMRALTGKRPA